MLKVAKIHQVVKYYLFCHLGAVSMFVSDWTQVPSQLHPVIDAMERKRKKRKGRYQDRLAGGSNTEN